MTNEECVRLFYRYLLGRELDPAGLKHWTEVANQEQNIKVVIEGFVHSPEFADRRASLMGPEYADLPSATLAACLERDLVIVDVGAQGGPYHYAGLVRSGINYRIIGFEPLLNRLSERLENENDPRLTLLPNFVGDGSERIFHVNNFDMTSSLLPLNRKLNALLLGLDQLETLRVESVKTDRLDTLLADIATIDFLKLDIQGFELEAPPKFWGEQKSYTARWSSRKSTLDRPYSQKSSVTCASESLSSLTLSTRAAAPTLLLPVVATPNA
jgi:FkbM family methyltransferase